MIVASLFEIIPTFLIRSNVPDHRRRSSRTRRSSSAGRDIYIREGCFNCHSQMIRPFRDETSATASTRKPGEFVYDHPFLWGSRRIGPDLAREGGKYPDLWHVRHMENPRSITPRSIMPPYPRLLDGLDRLRRHPAARRRDGDARRAVRRRGRADARRQMAREQAQEIARGIAAAGRAGRARGQGDRRADRVPAATRDGHHEAATARARGSRHRPATGGR